MDAVTTNPIPSNDLNNKIDAIERLLKLFKLERFIYAFICLLSVSLLMISAVYLFIEKDNTEEAIALFASTGPISVGIARLLVMWQDAIKILNVHATN
jgi:hypothetical protein